MAKKYSLTPEHRAQLPAHRDKWIANAMCTKAMTEEDREICRDAAARLYRAANLTPPPPHRIVFVPSPLAAVFAGGFAAYIWGQRQIATLDATLAAVHATLAATDDATRNATYAATHNATITAARAYRVPDADATTRIATNDAATRTTRNATYADTSMAVLAATDDATHGATLAATDDATRNATLAAVHATLAATDNAILDATRSVTFIDTAHATGRATHGATITAAHDAILDATDDATHNATHGATRNAVIAVTNGPTYAAVLAAIARPNYDATDDATRHATARATNDATRDAAANGLLAHVRAPGGPSGSLTARAATANATHDATRDAVSAATARATLATGAIGRATYGVTAHAIAQATYDATLETAVAATIEPIDNAIGAIYGATYDAIYAAAAHATRLPDLSRWYVLTGGDMAECANVLGVGRQGLLAARDAQRMYQAGNFWSSHDSYISFFRHVAKLPIDYSKWDAWETLSLRSSWRIMHPKFCIISDRPEVLLTDAEHRPHCDTGPFCRWRDGSALYSIHGVRVPAWLIEQPERLTVAAIDAEANQEIRRIMIGRYCAGQEISGAAAYVRDCNAELIDHDERWGTLRRRRREGDTDLLVVEVINSTPEPDGGYKHYWLRINPECRPLLRRQDGTLTTGKPQKLTALNAVASTFGMTGREYAATLGAES